MINIDFGDIGKPKFTRPELLNNDIIPMCLAGVNPRTLMGETRWKPIRVKAYEKNNRCCWICGRTPGEDRFANHLEGHERYSYDVNTCTAELLEVVALCRTCHFFVHIGRTVTKASLDVVNIHYILHRGLSTLNKAGLSARLHVAHAATLFMSPKHLERLYPTAMKVDKAAVERYVGLKLACVDKWVLKWEGKYYRTDARTAKPKEVKVWKHWLTKK